MVIITLQLRRVGRWVWGVEGWLAGLGAGVDGHAGSVHLYEAGQRPALRATHEVGPGGADG